MPSKSTLFRLLFRLYDPDGGDILIDGQPLRSVTVRSLRSAMAMVPQDLVLFNNTIRYNVAYGASSPDLNSDNVTALVERSTRLAHVHDAIEKMPKGYETLVGERGLKLSGGEKQRICLARALMKDPSIILLDEATSALDAESEHAIQEALDDITVNQGKTLLMISHRLKTAQTADKILVFHEGKVVEEGTHETLIAKPDGVYSALVRHQQLRT